MPLKPPVSLNSNRKVASLNGLASNLKCFGVVDLFIGESESESIDVQLILKPNDSTKLYVPDSSRFYGDVSNLFLNEMPEYCKGKWGFVKVKHPQYSAYTLKDLWDLSFDMIEYKKVFDTIIKQDISVSQSSPQKSHSPTSKKRSATSLAQERRGRRVSALNASKVPPTKPQQQSLSFNVSPNNKNNNNTNNNNKIKITKSSVSPSQQSTRRKSPSPSRSYSQQGRFSPYPTSSSTSRSTTNKHYNYPQRNTKRGNPKSTKLEKISVDGIQRWLDMIGMGSYKNLFQHENISGRALKLLSVREMRYLLGIPVGDAKIIKASADSLDYKEEHE